MLLERETEAKTCQSVKVLTVLLAMAETRVQAPEFVSTPVVPSNCSCPRFHFTLNILSLFLKAHYSCHQILMLFTETQQLVGPASMSHRWAAEGRLRTGKSPAETGHQCTLREGSSSGQRPSCGTGSPFGSARQIWHTVFLKVPTAMAFTPLFI